MLIQERTVKGVVMQMGAHEVYDVVSNMKQLVETEPDKAKQMFVSHPQVRSENTLYRPRWHNQCWFMYVRH